MTFAPDGATKEQRVTIVLTSLARVKNWTTIRRLNAEGISILLAEQNATMALRSAARGYVLAEGEIVRSDASSVLTGDPSVRAAYLGL